jgi:LytS/YehU family sensor histidine kinase
MSNLHTNSKTRTLQLQPLLFVTFIENAFKYSRIEEDEAGYIIIALEEARRRLSFTAANTVFAERKILRGSGQGISNVRQRLEIIYPGRHSLKFEGDELNFNVWLDIELTN